MWHGLHDSINFDKIGYNMCSWFLGPCACRLDGVCYAGCVRCFSSLSPVDGDLHPVIAETWAQCSWERAKKTLFTPQKNKVIIETLSLYINAFSCN